MADQSSGAQDNWQEEVLLALLVSYGNLAGSVAALAVGMGLDRGAAQGWLDTLNRLNDDTIPSKRAGALVRQQVEAHAIPH